MKTWATRSFMAMALVSTPDLQPAVATAQTAPATEVRNPVCTSNASAIPFDQIGVAAGRQYSGQALAVVSSRDSTTLRCEFQRLNGQVTTQGLWLFSTKDGARGEPFRVIARALGRASAEPLPRVGRVQLEKQVARFVRPGVTEEYSVGIDGLQQDFVIERRPSGEGAVRLELEVDGAKAEAMTEGARLVLADGGRQMVYNRLKAVDARGIPFEVKMEVLSPSRLAVILDDTAAAYPVRIDPTFSDANWISLGGGFGSVNGFIYAVAADDAGNLYVGGSFNIAGHRCPN
jgi:hypothetical protein